MKLGWAAREAGLPVPALPKPPSAVSSDTSTLAACLRDKRHETFKEVIRGKRSLLTGCLAPFLLPKVALGSQAHSFLPALHENIHQQQAELENTICSKPQTNKKVPCAYTINLKEASCFSELKKS